MPMNQIEMNLGLLMVESKWTPELGKHLSEFM